MVIAIPDIPCLWAETVTMAPYLKNSLPDKHLLLSTPHFEPFHIKMPILTYLNLFGCKYYVNIREDEHSFLSNYLAHPSHVIIVGYISSVKVYQIFPLEDDYVFMTQDLIFGIRCLLS
jgi:hypothetical protein